MFDTIYELFLQGYSAEAIADRLGIGIEFVQQVLDGLTNNDLETKWLNWFDTHGVSYTKHDSDIILSNASCRVVFVTSDLYSKCAVQSQALSFRDSGKPTVFLYPFDLYDMRFLSALSARLTVSYDSKHILGARECNIDSVSRKDTNVFLDRYHLQGSLKNLGTTFGLYYGDTLVSVIAVNKSRFEANHYELARYCFNPAYSVSGGFSRLLTHMSKTMFTPGDILVSYLDLDRRFSVNEVYAKNGFEEVGITPPSYGWWSDFAGIYLSRYETTKKRLMKSGFPEHMTECEIMKSRGFVQIYRAGSVRYEKVF